MKFKGYIIPIIITILCVYISFWAEQYEGWFFEATEIVSLLTALFSAFGISIHMTISYLES